MRARGVDAIAVDGIPARSLPVGSTPLIDARRLAPVLGVEQLWIKDDTRNPSLSFKDRPAAIAAERAVEFGVPALACASTGNLAGATAAAAAAVGVADSSTSSRGRAMTSRPSRRTTGTARQTSGTPARSPIVQTARPPRAGAARQPSVRRSSRVVRSARVAAAALASVAPVAVSTTSARADSVPKSMPMA